jgi:predicted MFS family arabinose efflux permease
LSRSAANTTGAAVGTAIAGVVIDGAGLSWSFGGAALGTLLAAVIALVHVGRRRPAAVPAVS